MCCVCGREAGVHATVERCRAREHEPEACLARGLMLQYTFLIQLV